MIPPKLHSTSPIQGRYTPVIYHSRLENGPGLSRCISYKKWGYSIQLQLCDRLPRRVLHFFWLGRKAGDFFPSDDLEGLGHTYHKHLIEGWRVWFQEPERRSRLFRCNNARIHTTGFYLVKLGGFKDTRLHRRIQPGQIIATSHDRWDPPKGSKLEGKGDPIFQGNPGW